MLAIEGRIAEGSLVITPAPKEVDFDSDAVNVHLGAKVYAWTRSPPGSTMTVSLWKTHEKFGYQAFAEKHLQEVPPDNDGIITIRPQTFYLADLKDYTKLPHDVAMHLQGKSMLARLGVMVHLTAPHVHAGWEGLLTLEIYNLGPFNIELNEGMPIGQLTFWQMDGPSQLISGQFSNQKNARG